MNGSNARPFRPTQRRGEESIVANGSKQGVEGPLGNESWYAITKPRNFRWQLEKNTVACFSNNAEQTTPCNDGPLTDHKAQRRLEKLPPEG